METQVKSEGLILPANKNGILNDLYVLKYKDRSLIAEKHFRFPSTGNPKEDKAAAIKRAMNFCERMRFRFIHCEEFCIDLDDIESRAFV